MFKQSENKEYFKLDKAIRDYEEFHYPEHKISWITNRISWAWKFRKISEKEKDSLIERIINIMSERPGCYS